VERGLFLAGGQEADLDLPGDPDDHPVPARGGQRTAAATAAPPMPARVAPPRGPSPGQPPMARPAWPVPDAGEPAPAVPPPAEALETGPSGGRAAAPRQAPGRQGRSGRPGKRSGRRRLRFWLLTVATGVTVAVAAAAATTVLRHGTAQSHVLVIPDKLGSFVRRPQLEQQMNISQLQQQVIAKSGGQASHVVSAVYENSAGVSGTGQAQIILFIGGNLTGVSPSGFISGFTTQFNGAQTASAGSMGGSASCVNAEAGSTGGVALCIWADNDTFGVVASPTMTSAQLSEQMRAVRPALEHTSK
jgi:hypothetical protein